MSGPAVGIVKLTTFAKLQMGNGKGQIECEMRNAKCEMKIPDARSFVHD